VIDRSQSIERLQIGWNNERNALRGNNDKIQRLEEEVGSQHFYYLLIGYANYDLLTSNFANSSKP